jgi:hypothetical protein
MITVQAEEKHNIIGQPLITTGNSGFAERIGLC